MRVIIKSLAFFLSFTIWYLHAPAQEKKGTEILNDPKAKNEIMEAICNDHDLMNEMMQHIVKSIHAMQMMKGDSSMMKEMMSEDQMEGVMKNDTSARNKMMSCMMKTMKEDSSMCSMMCKMMEKMHAEDKEGKMSCCKDAKTGVSKAVENEDMKNHNH